MKKIQVVEVYPERRKKSAKSEPTEESLDIPSLRIMPKVLGHGAGSSGVAKRVCLTLLSCEVNLRRNVGAHGKERGGSSIALALVPLATMYTLTRSLSNRLCYYLTLVHVVVLTSSNNIIIVLSSFIIYTQYSYHNGSANNTISRSLQTD